MAIRKLLQIRIDSCCGGGLRKIEPILGLTEAGESHVSSPIIQQLLYAHDLAGGQTHPSSDVSTQLVVVRQCGDVLTTLTARQSHDKDLSIVAVDQKWCIGLWKKLFVDDGCRNAEIGLIRAAPLSADVADAPIDSSAWPVGIHLFTGVQIKIA